MKPNALRTMAENATFDNHSDPICRCGHRKSAHTDTTDPCDGAGTRKGFMYSGFFNDLFLSDGYGKTKGRK